MLGIRRSAAVALLLGWGSLSAREYGPPVGSKMPSFNLKDQDGKAHSLTSLLGAKGAVILFFRSADWWPYCKAQLVELEQNREAIGKLGLGLAAVSYDSEAVLRTFAERKGIHFPLLSDPDSKIIRELGILNEAVEKTNPTFGIPHPGSFVLDAKGLIVAKYFEDDYRERYTAADLLMHQFGVIPAQAKSDVEGKQLRLTATASNAVVTVGQRVALTLDIELKPSMHVYAPGVEGYIPIDWTMKESDAGAVHAVSFPKSEKLHLPAIDETVPAYTGRFRLTRDVTIGAADKVKPVADGSGRFILEGTLRYQACDDRVCYIPQNLPVKWTLQFQDLDRQRVPNELQRK